MLGRTKRGTLRLFDEQRGLRFELDLPDSPLGENVREAVGRGDLDGASFRFVVGDEDWDGDVRTVDTVKELHDVTIATFAAYPAASVELRTRPPKEGTPWKRQRSSSTSPRKTRAPRSAPRRGGLRVADINQGRAENRTLHGAFRNAGWKPGRRTEIAWNEFESVGRVSGRSRSRAVSTTVDKLAPRRRRLRRRPAVRLAGVPAGRRRRGRHLASTC